MITRREDKADHKGGMTMDRLFMLKEALASCKIEGIAKDLSIKDLLKNKDIQAWLSSRRKNDM